MIKLSICIPTYNMVRFLRELLDSILQQNPDPDELEICISDNASTDNTQEVVAEYQRKYARITYYRAPENMGYDINCLKSMEIAQGEYCWLMGSDDCLAENALSKIYPLLVRHYDLILVNRLECDASLKSLYHRKWLSKDNNSQSFNLKSDDDFVKFAMEASGLGAFFSYMGSLIFLRNKWNGVKDSCRNMIGSGYIHVGMVLSFINTESFNLYYLNDSVVKCRLGNHDFLQNDFARRTLLDLIGYETFANFVLHDQLTKYRAFLSVLKQEVTRSLNLRRVLCAKFFSPTTSYAFLQAYYNQLFGCDLNMKFRIADCIHKIPLLNNFTKWLCLSMIKDTFGLKKVFFKIRWTLTD